MSFPLPVSHLGHLVSQNRHDLPPLSSLMPPLPILCHLPCLSGGQAQHQFLERTFLTCCTLTSKSAHPPYHALLSLLGAYPFAATPPPPSLCFCTTLSLLGEQTPSEPACSTHTPACVWAPPVWHVVRVQEIIVIYPVN